MLLPEFIVDFYDESPGAISWEWDVDGDDIIDYTEQNPTHVYTEPGIYDVVLNVSNSSETLTKAFPGRYNFKNNVSEDFINFSIKFFTFAWMDIKSWKTGELGYIEL